VRGTTSHFNFSTPLDAALIEIMAALIVGLWLLAAVAAGLLLRQRQLDAPFAWSLRLGLLIALVGMALAFLMPQPTSEQRAALAAGAPDTSTIIGAHSVGVPDGGPGLPIVGWSTLGGDLRVPHFFGLHALQVLPFIGWWLSRGRQARLGSSAHRSALIWTAGLGYFGLVLVLTWQALRGQSVIAPDLATLTGYAILVGMVLTSVGVIVVHARARRSVEYSRSALSADPLDQIERPVELLMQGSRHYLRENPR
jgi:hypothetical protein